MANPVLIELSLANIPPAREPLNPEEVYDFIESRVDGIETYQADPRKVDAAAIDYTVLYVAGSISSIGTALWMAYDKFIAPRKKRETERGGIYVAIRRADGTVADFFIGETYRDRDIFIGDFEAAVSEVREAPELPKAQAQRTYELKRSGVWIRRK